MKIEKNQTKIEPSDILFIPIKPEYYARYEIKSIDSKKEVLVVEALTDDCIVSVGHTTEMTLDKLIAYDFGIMTKKQMMEYAKKYCNDNDKSGAFMLEYIQEMANVDLDTARNFLIVNTYVYLEIRPIKNKKEIRKRRDITMLSIRRTDAIRAELLVNLSKDCLIVEVYYDEAQPLI